MVKTALITAVAACALIAAAPAAAQDVTLDGPTEGVLIPTAGGYRIVGTFIDEDTGQRGAYFGTLTEVTTGFTTCLVIFCLPGTLNATCNVLRGEMTIVFQGLRLSPAVGGSPISAFPRPGICLDSDGSRLVRFRLLRTDRFGPVFGLGAFFAVALPVGQTYQFTGDIRYQHFEPPPEA